VLSRFDEEEKVVIEKSQRLAADAVEVWVEDGIQKAMTRFNPDPKEMKKRAEKKLQADRKRAEVEKQKLESAFDASTDEVEENRS
jgi:hypothetical protein